MEVKILKDKKNEMDLELDSITVVEVLRVYLNKAGAKLAVWKQEHPTQNPVLHVESDNPKKIIKEAIANLQKEIDGVVADFKKLK